MEETRDFEERLARIYLSIGSNKPSVLARTLGIKAPSVAAAYKRQQIPGGWVETIAKKCGVSADWLFFGVGSMYIERDGHNDVHKQAFPLEKIGAEQGDRLNAKRTSALGEQCTPSARDTSPDDGIPYNEEPLSHDSLYRQHSGQARSPNELRRHANCYGGNIQSRCTALEQKLEEERLEWRELAQENRQLLKDNADLRERMARLEVQSIEAPKKETRKTQSPVVL